MAQCMIHSEGGFLCGKAALVFDVLRGGMVCADHAPNSEPEIKWLISVSAETAELFGDDECERHAKNFRQVKGGDSIA